MEHDAPQPAGGGLEPLLSRLSHDLRSPLTLILGPLEGLLGGSSLDPRMRDVLGGVHNNALRLLQMVERAGNLARLQAGLLEAQREPVDAGALLRRIVADFDPPRLARRQEIFLRIELRRPLVELDVYLFERIVFNLLSNAVKFTPEGGRIEVGLRQRGKQLELRVADSGPGIPAAEREQLHERFSQAGAASAHLVDAGGLGLTVVQEFAHLLGGRVRLESELGQGSSFTVELHAPTATAERGVKLQRGPASRPPLPLATAEGPEAPVDGRPLVLLAEDNPELAAYTAERLAHLGAVRHVTDGLQALQAVRELHPHLVLSDVRMPGIDGFALCRAIKADPETRGIPVVLLTALTGRDALLEGWESGADEYLFKPFHPRELETRVRTLLALAEERRAAEQARIEKRALERSNDELEEYAFVASHDLQEPLRKIRVFGDRLRSRCGERLDAQSADHLQRMLDAAERMQTLIRKLLYYSQLRSSARPFETVELEPLLRSVTADLEHRIEEAGAQVEIGALPAVRGDRAQLYQLFANLLRNALKFRRRDAPLVVRIHGVCETSPRICRIFVEDNGIGFDAEAAERIFHPFERLHPASAYPGSGMGLSICRRIAERHRGRIEGTGRLGEGAVFTVSLPG